MKGKAALSLGMIVLLVLAFGFQALAQGKKPIVVGFVHTMSGGMSMYGISSEFGGQLAVEEINAAGGVLGRPMKMITRDDKLNPEVGLREAKDLLWSEKVDFLSGTISSAVALAISNLAKKEKKLYFVTIAHSSPITEENFHPYVFRISSNTVPYFGYAPAIAHFKKWKDKKFVSLGFDYESGRNSIKQFKEKYMELVPDAKFGDEMWCPLNTTDFTPYITKIANSGAEALFLAVIYGGGEIAFTRQANDFGLYDKFHMNHPCAGDVETWSNVKKGEPYPRGALATCRYPFWAFQDPRNKAFVEKHYNKLGFYPSYGALYQYTAMYAMKAGIEKVGGVETEKMIKALEGMVLDTLIGKIPLRAFDHQTMMPTWYGTMDFAPALSFPHITQIEKMGEESYHTIDQIKKIRRAK